MKLQPKRRVSFSIGLILIVIVLAPAIVRAQAPPFIERGLPGSAFAGVVPAPNGRLYGLTYDRGTFNQGTLYSVDSALTAVLVHINFNGANGAEPYDELTFDAASGKFYGATSRGGPAGLGTIFSFDPATNVLTTLKGDFDFSIYEPRAPFVVSGGFIYGVLGRPFGGVFRMATDGSGFTVIHQFTDFNSIPYAVTIGADGYLYGVTLAGGIVCHQTLTDGCGTVFRLRHVLPGDTDVQFQTLYEMQIREDAGPQRTVVYGSDDLIYFNNHRRIFRLNPNNPAATFQMIWDEPGGSVSMSIIEGADNRIYAASYSNSQSFFAGSVFSLNRDGSDNQVLRTFSFMTGSMAYGPYGKLYRSPSGVIYGTTEYTISPPEYGTVFAIGAGSNSPPALSNVAATTPVTEGDSTTLSGNISDPNANDTFSLEVNWGDGSPPQVFNYAAGTTSFSETHQYLDDNPSGTSSDNYTISLTLADNNGGSDNGSAAVTVNNAPPVLSNVTANPPVIAAGQATSLSGFVNDAGALDPHDVTINWGDGSPDTVLNLGAGVNSFNTVHQYNSIGTFNISITATDDDAGSDNAGVVLTVNTPPVLSNVAITSPITENGTATLSGNITDPNGGDVFTLTVDWGDGSPLQFFGYAADTTSFSETHQYRDDNPTGTPSDNYQINVTLSDGLETDTGSATITVNNAPPALNNLAANPATINVGGITNLSGLVTDAGTLDTHQVVINWGDGTPNTTINLPVGVGAFNANHQYNASGSFTIGVSATDDDTGGANGSVSVTVNPSPQQPPVLSNVAVTSPIIENGTATLTGNISDPNAGDTFVLAVNWGDGSPIQMFSYPAGTTAFSQTHQYLDDNPTGTPSDNYTINLTLNDNAGGSDGASTIITINNAPPVLSNITANPTTISITGTTNLSGTITDVGTLDTQQVVIDWGDGTPVTTLNLAAGVDAFNASHQYNTAGAFNIAVAATDDDTGTATGGASVTVSPNQLSTGKIVFASLRDGNYEIYSMNADGSNQTRLTDNPAIDYAPAISPDGNRVVFRSERDGNREIYIMNADGTGQTRLTESQQPDSQPSFSPDGNRIVFTSVRNGNLEIFVMNADGSNQKRLTNNAANDFDPVFSPDGSKIAFTSQRDGFGQVYLMNADGTNQVRLTSFTADEFDPSFSPDGTRIAFTSFRHGATAEIYTMNINGADQRRLTENAAGDISASFSPDGNQIAFVSNRDGRLEVYVMNADGSGQMRLTDNPEGNEVPSWGVAPSPTGGKIVFASDRDGNLEIYSMNANGTNQTRLTNHPEADFFPSISPDGSRIVFVSLRDGNREIYVMNADGTGQFRLTTNSAIDGSPSFSPDGNRIVFHTNRHGNYEIYVMNADGTNQFRLSNNSANDYEPTFSPDGSRIAFMSDRNGNFDIYSMNANGTDQAPLTNNPANDVGPSFSLDGSLIVFVSYRDGTAQIYVMNAEGTDQTRLSDNLVFEAFPRFSPDGNQIIFTSYRDGNGEIYVMNADGTDQKQLTNNPADDNYPSWAITPMTALGRKIVFHSYRDGNANIYTMNSNGTNQTPLTNDPADDYEASFSPDGSRIVFVSDRDGNGEIYVMNADGTNQTRLTFNPALDTEPSFSPDGKRIVFTSYRNNNADIYVMNADGHFVNRLTDNPGDDINPTFSPDGNRIAFASDRGAGLSIYLMNANGSNPTRLTAGYEPSFRPDGNRIAFTSFEGNSFGVFTVNTNGRSRVRLTSNLSFNYDPAFSPDGSQIAFESVRDGNSQIYLMNANGSNQTRLTDNSFNDYSPSWGGLVLPAPTNLTATAVSPTQINLAWTDNSVGEDGFAIERCKGNNCTIFIRIASTGPNAVTFASSGLDSQTFYTYRVRAFGPGGDSPYSNTARDKTSKP